MYDVTLVSVSYVARASQRRHCTSKASYWAPASMVTIGKPSEQEAAQFPREFALYTLLDKKHDGKLDAKVCVSLLRHVRHD